MAGDYYSDNDWDTHTLEGTEGFIGTVKPPCMEGFVDESIGDSVSFMVNNTNNDNNNNNDNETVDLIRQPDPETMRLPLHIAVCARPQAREGYSARLKVWLSSRGDEFLFYKDDTQK